MIDFSFIVPVYNAGTTLERCLNSIKSQKYENYEVIMIDDGSDDNSYEICLSYEKADKRFNVLHQTNQGPSSARNRGIDAAKGRWICFVDSDDSIQDNYLEKIFEVIYKDVESEVIFIGYTQVNTLGIKLNSRIPKKFEKDYYKNLIMLSNEDMFGYTWIKCFKRENIGEVRFDESIKLFEDEIFTCQVLQRCRHIGYVYEAVYNYSVDTEGALTKRTYQNYCVLNDKVFDAWKILLKEYEYSENVLKDKSQLFINRCHYYGLEHNVKLKDYYVQLSKTQFFALCNDRDFFINNIYSKRFIILCIEKKIYVWKIKLSKKMKK